MHMWFIARARSHVMTRTAYNPMARTEGEGISHNRATIKNWTDCQSKSKSKIKLRDVVSNSESDLET